MDHIVYKFTSDSISYNKINGVSISYWANVDNISKSVTFYITAIAKNENDLVLFTLANPSLKLFYKEVKG